MNTNWNLLTRVEQIDELKQQSFDRPVLIFKHSTTCGISHSIYNQMEDSLTDLSEFYTLYYLDLLAHREVSNAVAKEFNVIHQSPQTLVIKNGQCVEHSSHYAIKPKNLLEKV